MTVFRGRVSFVPKDATKREHVGRVDRVVWASDDDTRVILALADGSSMIGPGSRSQFTTGEQYRFRGNWRDSQRGPQFHFDTHTQDVPATGSGVVAYLSKLCRGVGQRTAADLFDAYGSDAVRVLREQPDRVAADGILPLEVARYAAADLERYAELETTRVALFDLFAGRGFPGKLIDACIGKWGVAAPKIIERQPFRLLTNKLPGCGFKRVDRLYLDRGFPADSLKRQALAGWNAFKDDRTGSTWLKAEDCVETILSLIPGADPIRALRLLIRAGWLRVRRDGAERYLALRERADAERRVADHVRRLNRSRSHWPAELLASRTEGDGLPSQHQVDQFKRATVRPVGCFVGGPGTGKTFTLAAAIKQIQATFGLEPIRVTAPTGKASVRAGEALRANGVQLFATTVHRLLEVSKNGHGGESWGFARNARNPLDCRFLIVDETSMVDIVLLADLLDACADGTHVLFVGDPFQLPPVGCGAPLRDLIVSGAVPVGELTEVRRNAGSVVRGCASIKGGQPVTFDVRLDLDAGDPKNLKIVDVPQGQLINTVEDVLQALTRFDRVWETQVITGLNDKGDGSRKALNDRLGKLLNPNGRAARGNPFRVGDKIVCRRNGFLKTFAPSVNNLHPTMAGDADAYLPQPFRLADGSAVSEWYVANGEIGRVVAVSEKRSVVRFGGADVPLLEVGVGKRQQTEEQAGDAGEGKSVDFEPAWAITCHSSQGSEWPCVIVVVDDAAATVADRNWHYTAISRARRACIVIGAKTTFDKQVKRQSIDRRRTFLADLLKENT